MSPSQTAQSVSIIKKLKFYTILGFITPIVALLVIGLPILHFEATAETQQTVQPYGLALQYPILAVLVYIVFVFLQIKDYRKRFRSDITSSQQVQYKPLYRASLASLCVDISLPIIAILSLIIYIIFML